MTEQEIFNTVWNHFVTEGKPISRRLGGQRCWYRGPDGAKCAVGLFIPDEKYTEGVESLPPSELGDLLVAGAGDHIDLLEDLRDAHDGSDNGLTEGNPMHIRNRLAAVARDRGLTVPS